MMKARMKVDGREALVLGLSYANLDRLRAEGFSGSIKIPAEDHGMPFDIIITAEKTEAHMVEIFEEDGLIGPDTEVHIDPRLKS